MKQKNIVKVAYVTFKTTVTMSMLVIGLTSNILNPIADDSSISRNPVKKILDAPTASDY